MRDPLYHRQVAIGIKLSAELEGRDLLSHEIFYRSAHGLLSQAMPDGVAGNDYRAASRLLEEADDLARRGRMGESQNLAHEALEHAKRVR